MIYIFRRAASDSAVELAEALNDANLPAFRTQGGKLREPRVLERLASGRDRLICWGEARPVNALHVLNGAPVRNKFQDAMTLREAGVSTVEVSQARPPVHAPVRLFSAQGFTGPEGDFVHLHRQGVMNLRASIDRWLAEPDPVPVEWLPRRNNHVGGRDLLAGINQGDYYSKKEPLVDEYRLHSFLGKSIRAGKKTRRATRPDGVTPSHDWIRSFDAGWVIAYEEFKSSKEMRDLAARACAALGLEFGAVDIGQRQDGSLVVLEVNRAPGIEGGSTEAYVKAIKGWIEGGAA